MHTGSRLDFNDKWTVYLLGLLWADGHLSKHGQIQYQSVLGDFNEVKNALATWKLPSFKEYQAMRDGSPFGRRQGRFYCASKEVGAEFLLLNYRNKSYSSPDLVISKIPESLRHLFWRGYFDGDGCLYLGARTELAFWSTIDQDWNALESLFKELGIKKYSLYKYNRKNGTHCSSVIRTGVSADIKTFCDYIYQDCERIGFSRKHKKYQEFLIRYETIKINKLKTSKHKGICFNKANEKWLASIHKNKINKLNKPIFVGWFNSEQEAHLALESKKASLL